MTLPIRFKGPTIHGLGEGGKTLRVPTINIEPTSVPSDLIHGVYAGRALLDDTWVPAAIHYGPRPVFDAPESFEVHVIDRMVESMPPVLTVEVLERLRDVRDFPSKEALRETILEDIRRTKEIAG